MKRITREEWIAALRSGEYPQTQTFLWADGSDRFVYDRKPVPKGYCCLGVACAIAGVDLTVFGTNDLNTNNFASVGADDLGEWLNLNEELRERLGTLNDGGKSFSEIADRIEQDRILED
jgi:hypothetical protein